MNGSAWLLLGAAAIGGGAFLLTQQKAQSEETTVSNETQSDSGAIVSEKPSPDHLSFAEISEYASAAGFSGEDLVNAVAIAWAESKGNRFAKGDLQYAPERGPSIGLWQINIGSKAHPEYEEQALYDPQQNADAAYRIFSASGYSFDPWSTYNTMKQVNGKWIAVSKGDGPYTRYLSQANAVVNG